MWGAELWSAYVSGVVFNVDGHGICKPLRDYAQQLVSGSNEIRESSSLAALHVRITTR